MVRRCQVLLLLCCFQQALLSPSASPESASVADTSDNTDHNVDYYLYIQKDVGFHTFSCPGLVLSLNLPEEISDQTKINISGPQEERDLLMLRIFGLSGGKNNLSSQMDSSKQWKVEAMHQVRED